MSYLLLLSGPVPFFYAAELFCSLADLKKQSDLIQSSHILLQRQEFTNVHTCLYMETSYCSMRRFPGWVGISNSLL